MLVLAALAVTAGGTLSLSDEKPYDPLPPFGLDRLAPAKAGVGPAGKETAVYLAGRYAGIPRPS